MNSALQRARRTMADRVPARTQQQALRSLPTERLRMVAARFATALEDGDVRALVAMLTEDVTWSMPPMPHWYQGRQAVAGFAEQVPLSRCGTWRHLPTGANGQVSVASYLDGNGAGVHLPWSINVLTICEGRVAHITSFIGHDYFSIFGLPLGLVTSRRLGPAARCPAHRERRSTR